MIERRWRDVEFIFLWFNFLYMVIVVVEIYKNAKLMADDLEL